MNVFQIKTEPTLIYESVLWSAHILIHSHQIQSNAYLVLWNNSLWLLQLLQILINLEMQKQCVLESIYNLGFLVEYSVCCKILEENDLIELSLFFLHPWPALKCNLHFMHFLKTAPGFRVASPHSLLQKSVLHISDAILKSNFWYTMKWKKVRSVSDPLFAPF